MTKSPQAGEALRLELNNSQKILSPRVHIFAKDRLDHVLCSPGNSEENSRLAVLLPKNRKIILN